MDTNADGCITKNNLAKGLEKTLGIKNENGTIDKIFDSIDFDHNNLITISEFITAGLNRKLFLKRDKLEIAFKMLDRDASGEIELFELIKIFYKSGVSKEAWVYMFKELD